MSGSLSLDGQSALPPARDIPSTFTASFRSWWERVFTVIVLDLDIFQGGQQARRGLPLAKNGY